MEEECESFSRIVWASLCEVAPRNKHRLFLELATRNKIEAAGLRYKTRLYIKSRGLENLGQLIKEEKKMALQNTRDMLQKASEAGYAVPAFNFHNLETALTIIQAAVKKRSPLLLDFSISTISYEVFAYVHYTSPTYAVI